MDDPVVGLVGRVSLPDQLEAHDAVPVEGSVAAAVERHAAADLLHQDDDLLDGFRTEEDSLTAEAGDVVREDVVVLDEANAVEAADLAGEETLGVAVEGGVDEV